MNESTFKRSFLTSTVVHVVVVLAVILVPLIKRLIRPRKPPEMITFIDLAALPPPPPPQIESPPITPEPTPQPPTPDPPPVPDPPKPPLIPEKPPEKKAEKPPGPKKPSPPKIKVSTNKIVRQTQPPKPAQPAQPKLTQDQLRKLLEANIKFSPSGNSSANFSDLSLYYATVYDAMYGAWRQPSSAAMGLTAQVAIRVQRNGTVTNPRLVRSSGSKTMDDSVLDAVRRVARLRPLPAEVRDTFLDITIEFVVGQ